MTSRTRPAGRDGRAVEQTEVDHVDAELRVDDVAESLLDRGDVRIAADGRGVPSGHGIVLGGAGGAGLTHHGSSLRWW